MYPMQFIEVNDARLLEKIYAFRYRILEENETTRPMLREAKSTKKECDEYDGYSRHFALFNSEEEVLACLRLIRYSEVGLPTLNHSRHECGASECPPEHLGELSRIFFDKRLRGISKLRPLFDSLKLLSYRVLLEEEMSDSVGFLEPPFLRLLRMFGFPYEAIGPLQEHFGSRYPCRLNTRELYRLNREFFESKGVV
jgi:N-acyl-L-homoserine lactone synthetase